MRVCENGIYRDATQEEIEEIQKIQQKEQNHQEEITIEERVSAIEEVILNLL